MSKVKRDHHNITRDIKFSGTTVKLEHVSDALHMSACDNLTISSPGSTATEGVFVKLLPNSGYDAKIHFMEGVSWRWTMGNDGSDNTDMPFKFDYGTDIIGDATKLQINSDGKLVLSNGESIDNSVDGTIRLTSIVTKVGSSGYMSLSDNEIDISSGDLELDVAGDIILNADGDNISFKAGLAAAEMAKFTSNANYSELLMYERGGETDDDYFRLRCTEHGAVEAMTKDTAAANAHITFTPDGEFRVTTETAGSHVQLDSGRDVILNATRAIHLTSTSSDINLISGGGNIHCADPISITETASAPVDVAGRGQIWVKNDAPNNLYFTDDTGQDVAITNDGALAGGGGGSSYVLLGPFGGRVGSVNSDTNFWMAGTYGVTYPFWSSTNQLADRNKGGHDVNEYLMSSRVVTVPFAATLKGFVGTFYTSATSTEYLFEIWKATPSYPTSTVSDLVFSEAATFTSSGSDSYKMCTISKTDASTSVAAGDVLAIYVSRASGSGSGYVYLSMNILLEKS